MEREVGSPAPGPAPALVVEEGRAKGARFEVEAGGLLIGRSAEAAVTLEGDLLVSREHARVTRAPAGDLIVEDLGSRNGTHVNETTITEPRTLRPGDRVRIGLTTFRVGDRDARDDTVMAPAVTAPGTTAPAQPTAEPREVLEEAKRLYAARRFPESEEAFRRLLPLPQYAAEGHYGVGLVRLSLGDLDQGEAEFGRSLASDPAYANSAFQLGVIAERRGQVEEAIAHYRRAVEINAAHAGAKKALERMAPGDAAAPDLESISEGIVQYGVYEFLRRDKSPLSKQALAEIDSLTLDVRPYLSAFLGSLITKFLFFVGAALGAALLTRLDRLPLPGERVLVLDIPSWVPFAILALGVLPIIYSVVLIATMRIRIQKGRLQVEKGIFTRKLTNLELWRVKDIELKQGFWNRLTGDGTLVMTAYQEEKPVDVTGIARGQDLRDMYQRILNVAFLLRSSPVVKGIVM